MRILNLGLAKVKASFEDTYAPKSHTEKIEIAHHWKDIDWFNSSIKVSGKGEEKNKIYERHSKIRIRGGNEKATKNWFIRPG